MVSLEDYEYSAFRCAFCKVLNPARKIRPKAPSLSIENIGSTIRPSSSTSSSDKDSGSDSEGNQKDLLPCTEILEQQPSTETSSDPSTEISSEPTTEDFLQPSQSEEEKIEEDNTEEKSVIDKKTD